MSELISISFTFDSLMKVILIIIIDLLLNNIWYSPLGFIKQWRKAIEWKDGDEYHSKSIFMTNIATLFNSFLLNILLISFDIRKQQWISAILASTILTGFYAINGWKNLFFSKKLDYQRYFILYLIDIGFTFVLYALISLILNAF